MTDDLATRLAALEQDRDQARRRMVYAAAQRAGLHGPELIADRLVDTKTIVTAADADRAVADFAQANPYMRREPEQITVEEQKRRWGQELLDAIDEA